MTKTQRFAQADPTELVANPWNTNRLDPDAEKRLDQSIKRLGMFKPIIVRQLPDGSLQILGGQHRNESAIRLKMPKIDILNLGEISDSKAKEIGIVDNGRYGNDDALELAKLLNTLGTPEDLASFMPYTEADFASIFSATEINFDALTFDEGGSDPEVPKVKAEQTSVVMRFKIPLDDQSWIGQLVENTMKEQGFDQADSLTNAGDAFVYLMGQLK